MCYDDNNIYVLVSVHDATPNQVGFASWASDCVELYFAMDTSNSYAYRYGDWEFRKQSALSLSDGGVEAYDLNGNVSIDYLINQTEFGVNRLMVIMAIYSIGNYLLIFFRRILLSMAKISGSIYNWLTTMVREVKQGHYFGTLQLVTSGDVFRIRDMY